MFKLLRFLKPFAIVDTGIVNGDARYILRIGGLMLLVAAGGVVCSSLASFLSARAGMGFGSDLRGAVFSQVQGFSLREFDRIGTPSLITRTTNDITQIQMFAMVTMRMMVSAPIMAIGGVIMAQRVNTVMGADRIVVLDEGRVIGTGTHRELLRTCSC
jgi:ATP-binding cassette subfamily B protein